MNGKMLNSAEQIEYTRNNRIKLKGYFDKINELIESKADIEIIRSAYNELKEWLDIEYKQAQKYCDGYISQWYYPLIRDVYVGSEINSTKTNSTSQKIGLAIADGEDYLNYWEPNDQGN